MGIFDGIKNEILDKVASLSSQNPLLEQVLNLMNNPQTGGLAGLIESFKEKGLGQAAASWIARGKNEPISGEQIQQVLGSDRVKEMAEKAGLPVVQAAGGLASLLPMIIDKLTPDGQLPQGNLMEQAMHLFKDNKPAG